MLAAGSNPFGPNMENCGCAIVEFQPVSIISISVILNRPDCCALVVVLATDAVAECAPIYIERTPTRPAVRIMMISSRPLRETGLVLDDCMALNSAR